MGSRFSGAGAGPTVGEYNGFFEGTEKRLEVDFAHGGGSFPDLRSVSLDEWKEVVRLSRTQVLNSITTPAFTSLLLSESSLLVYPQKVILKTCGRTVPIDALEKIAAIGRAISMEPEWVCFSRKSFLAPSAQPAEHQTTENEIESCQKATRAVAASGSQVAEDGAGDAYILGPLTGEHWLIYNKDFQYVDGRVRGDFTVDMMMYELPRDIAQHFYTSEPEGSASGAASMTETSGLGGIIDWLRDAGFEVQIDDYCFAPCGYSCNVHIGDFYFIVHVTPEESCSFASFETNLGSLFDKAHGPSRAVGERLNGLVEKVLACFRPRKFTATLFADSGAQEAVGAAPFEAAGRAPYRKTNLNSYHFGEDYIATVANYSKP